MPIMLFVLVVGGMGGCFISTPMGDGSRCKSLTTSSTLAKALERSVVF